MLNEYSRIKETARDDDEIIVNSLDRTYADKYINGVWQNPYETIPTMAITPPVKQYNKKTFQVVFPSNLFLTNNSGSVQALQIDFQDRMD